MSVSRVFLLLGCWVAVSVALVIVMSAVIRGWRNDFRDAMRNARDEAPRSYTLDDWQRAAAKRAPFTGSGRGRD